MACHHQDVPEDIKPPLNMGSDSNLSHCGILADIKEESESPTSVQVRHGTFTSDSKSFQPVVIKTEDDVFSEFEFKYTKEDQYMTWKEGTSGSRNVKDNLIEDDIASPSSLCGLTSEVDLGIIKMKEEEDIISEATEREDRRSGQQLSEYKSRRFRYGGKFYCIKCEKIFSSKQSLYDHIVTVHSDDADLMKSVTWKIHRCEHCRYTTVQSSHLTQHMRTHGAKLENTFKCKKCEKAFSAKRFLDNHTLKRHSDNDDMMESISHKIHRCKHCSFITVFASNFTQHMWKHGEKLKETFDCITCEKEFSCKFNLDNHIVTRHSDNDEMMNSVTCKIHRCKHCSYYTVHGGNFVQHIRKHGGEYEKTFDCIKCERTFLTKRTLDNHIVTKHSNNDEIMDGVTSEVHHCKHCSYMTVVKTHLVRHIRTHEEKFGDTFNCIKCDEKFSSKYCLDGHIVAEHNNDDEMMNSVTIKIHRCKHCKYMTVYASRFVQHMKKHGENLETTFHCTKCKKKLSSKRSLDFHIVTHHSNDAGMMKGVTNRIYHCKRCRYTTVKATRLTEHMRTHGENLEKPLTV